MKANVLKFLSIISFLFISLTGISRELEVNKVLRAKISDPIGPITVEFFKATFEKADKENAHILIFELDTPGGLDTSMREIIKMIETSKIPVVVYVSPPGARAASAGAFITLSAHIAAMAPGTNIGAAHPVNLGGKEIDEEMMKKVENDAAAYAVSLAKKHNRNTEWAEKAVRESISTDAAEALKMGVIDLIAENLQVLLEKLNGREIYVNGEKVRIKLDRNNAEVMDYEMSFRLRFLNFLSNPNLAYILMMIGIWGLFFELSNPGAIFPGVIGAISLILAFVAFQTLPVNYAGIFLILLGIIFFIAEIKITSYGLLSIAGAISMFLGSLMLFEYGGPYYKLSLRVLIPTFLLSVGFIIFALFLAIKAQMKKPSLGFEGLIGEEGEAITDIDKKGKVFVHGEYWDAFSDESIKKGEPVKVISVQGFKLHVRKLEEK